MKTIFTTLSAAAIGAALFAPAYAVAAPAPAATSTVNITTHDAQKTIVAKHFTARAGTGITLQTWDVGTTDGASFLALCIEPGQNMATGLQSYSTDTTFSFADASAARQDSIGRLYSLYYSQITGTDEKSKDLSLSFQVALWELYNDDANLASTAGKLSLNTTVTNNRGNGVGDYAGAKVVIEDATAMLLKAQDTSITYTPAYTFTKFSSATSQDFVIAQAVSPVPEPATYAMLGLGLALVGFTARRKSQR